MSKEEKVGNSKGKGKEDGEGPHGTNPDLVHQLFELKKTFRRSVCSIRLNSSSGGGAEMPRVHASKSITR
jgi:hypothetical protein